MRARHGAPHSRCRCRRCCAGATYRRYRVRVGRHLVAYAILTLRGSALEDSKSNMLAGVRRHHPFGGASALYAAYPKVHYDLSALKETELGAAAAADHVQLWSMSVVMASSSSPRLVRPGDFHDRKIGFKRLGVILCKLIRWSRQPNDANFFFCSAPSEESTQPLLLPWRDSEGWWTCAACAKTKAKTQVYALMDKRNIIGVSAFPEWFREWGLFSIRRTNNTLTDMVLIDFPCQFAQNESNAENTDGRLRLCEGKIYVDMASEDHRLFKQVPLDNILAENPSLYDNGELTPGSRRMCLRRRRRCCTLCTARSIRAPHGGGRRTVRVTDDEGSSAADGR